MTFDEILQEIGEFGPYQKRTFYMMSLPAVICGMQVLGAIFIYDIPAHRCAIPEFPRDSYQIRNQAHARLINYTIPAGSSGDEGDYSRCEIYDTTNTSVFLSLNDVGNNTDDNRTRGTRECARRVFDKSHHQNTIITEFDLVCGGEIMRAHANSLGFLGSFLGSLGMGIIADVFGRKKAIILALVIHIASGLTTVLAQSFYLIMAARIFAGIASHALFAIPASTGIELVGPNKRSFTGTAIEFYWAAGVALILPVAYFSRQWRYTQLVTTLLAVPLLGLWWLIPESPRWLLDKERFKEVEVILQRICKSNKTKLPAGSLTADTNNEEGTQLKIWGMFTNKTLILRCLIIFLNWYAVNLFYYGLSLNMTNLEGDPYLNYLYSVLVEVAAYMACMALVPRVGRLKLHFTMMTIGGLAQLAVIPVIVTGGNAWIITVLAQVGKFCASSCYTILYILSSELFPTLLRNSGIGFCSIFESMGGMCSPYIADLGLLVKGPFGKSLSMIVFGSLSILAAAASLLLPETLHRKLPESIQDAIDFDKQNQMKPKNKDYEMAPTIRLVVTTLLQMMMTKKKKILISVVQANNSFLCVRCL